jgi:transposase-like protein
LQGKELQVGKKRVGRHPEGFRRRAVERMRTSDNIAQLAQELGVHRRLLYQWRDQFYPDERGERLVDSSAEPELRRQVQQLKRVLAEKTLELDFFKGALQKVESRRQKRGKTGEKASTPKSGT